jgi:hypothetical protein
LATGGQRATGVPPWPRVASERWTVLEGVEPETDQGEEERALGMRKKMVGDDSNSASYNETCVTSKGPDVCSTELVTNHTIRQHIRNTASTCLMTSRSPS